MLVRDYKFDPDADMGPGWCPAWMDNADPVEGFTAAHDCLEHFPVCVGGFEGEMMAMGAMHFTRQCHPDMTNLWEDNAFDIRRFLQNVQAGAETLKHPGRVIWDGMDDYRTMNLSEGRFQIAKAVEDANEANYPVSVTLPEDAAERILGWMVKGYRKARARFKRAGLTEFHTYLLWKQVEEKFDKTRKFADEWHTIRVRIGLKAQKVDVVILDHNNKEYL